MRNAADEFTAATRLFANPHRLAATPIRQKRSSVNKIDVLVLIAVSVGTKTGPKRHPHVTR
jgi:hypothetical protein